MKVKWPSQAARAGEWVAALVGAVNCILVPAAFAESQGSLFPFPGLYLVQIALVGVLVLAFVALRSRLPARGSALPWLAAGTMLAFVVLGGFSIGPYLTPALLAFVVTGVLVDLQDGESMARHVGYLLVAAVAQAGVMMAMTLF